MADIAAADTAKAVETAEDPKRRRILDAARRVFERDGLDGASLRGIAKEAGYTAPALYFHFDSKEGIYAAVLSESLDRLNRAVAASVDPDAPAADRLRAAALGFFRFYADNPRDLDLGFYLFRGGMTPRGLGTQRDEALNAALAAALAPVGAAARDLGADDAAARDATVDVFAQAAGLLLLSHTGRIRMFGADAGARMACYTDDLIRRLTGA